MFTLHVQAFVNRNMVWKQSWKSNLAKLFFYLCFIFIFVTFYVKDLMNDFIEGRSTMTSQYQTVESIEFPTVTLCMVPGHKNSVIKKYGWGPAMDILLKNMSTKSLSDVFNEASYINGSDMDILDDSKEHLKLNFFRALNYSIDPINTFHHGTCYKLQPFSPITETPQYLGLKIVLKDINGEDKPTGVKVFLTSNKTWQNIANEQWPQINPTQFLLEFKDKGLVKGMKLKLTENRFQEGTVDIADCHRNLYLNKYNCTNKCSFLSSNSLPVCNSTQDENCGTRGRKSHQHEFINCFKVKKFLTYNPTTYDFLWNPILNSSTIQFFMSIQDLQKEVREEVKAITPESFIGSLGGSVGMFFGFSFTSTILYMSKTIKGQYDRFRNMYFA